jgi:uncharacterized phage protein (TIGR01671 family)
MKINDRYLFKAIDTNSVWRTGLLIALKGNRCAIEESDGSKWACDAKTLCQCTGLKDKNGKLIWENDIVNLETDKAVVIWDRAEWRIKWIKDTIWRKDLHFWTNEDDWKCEVIGNIFDNPELLESEEQYGENI